jgi:hypothetical protein
MRRMLGLVAVLMIGAGAQPAAAQPLPDSAAAAQALGCGRVADCLQALQARDGRDTIVTHSEGWVVVNEPPANAQWSFVPPGHAAAPALVRRTIRRDAAGVHVDTLSLCEGPAAACAQLRADFAALNERIIEAHRNSGRQPMLTLPR